MNKFKKNIKGITLIALVVTILVLLILVGVAISLSIGNNGLFSRAKKAVTVNKSSTIVERLELALGEYQTVRPFLSTEEEQKNELEKILKNIEGIEEVRYDEETKKFTVIIENETFLVDLDGSYERKNMTINITKEKTGEGVKIKVKVTSKQEIESIVISKDGNSNTLDINKKNEEYTTEKIVEEEGIYQVNVRTETGEEEIVNIMVDLGGPQIEHSFNQENYTINMKVTDTGSGIKKIQVYSEVSKTETGEITESKVEEFNYEDSPKEKQEASKMNNIPFGGYLRRYKIIAEDEDGNITTEEYTFNPAIQSYIIMNEEQLKSFRDTVNNGNNFSGKTIYLGADIELNKGKYTLDETGKIPTFSSDAEAWIPIKGFSGIFDGQGHYISGIYINSTDINMKGMFGHCEGVIVKNLGVICTSIEGSNASYTGGIIAEGGNSTERFANVDSCYFSGRIKGSSPLTGGISSRCANVSRCYFDGIIEAINNAAGIIGSGTATDCYSRGKIPSGEGWRCGVTGGIAKNSYTVTLGGSGFYDGGVAPTPNSNSINCYFLKGTWTPRQPNPGVTEAEEKYMKSDEFVKALNNGRDIWTRDDNINDGYPILKSINYRK